MKNKRIRTWMMVALAIILTILSVCVFNVYSDWRKKEYQVYLNSKKVYDAQEFKDGLVTGDALLYGELSAVDAITSPELKGEYIYLKIKVTEKLSFKTRVLRDVQEMQCENVSLLGVLCSSDKFDYSNVLHYITTISDGNYDYEYYGVDASICGTFFTTIENGEISYHTDIYPSKTIEETLDSIVTDTWIISFFFLDAVVMLCISIGAYCLLLRFFPDDSEECF